VTAIKYWSMKCSIIIENINRMIEGAAMSDYKKYECDICGHIYDESQGDPDSGIPPGTRWQDVPENWRCPECGASKSHFKLLE